MRYRSLTFGRLRRCICRALFLTLIFSALFQLDVQASSENALSAPASTDTTAHRRVRIGLALGGGGTRSLAQIGVLRVLEREGIGIDSIAGVSMGAVIGGLYAAGLSTDELEKIYLSQSIERAYFHPPLPVRLSSTPLFLLARAFGYHPYAGLYAGDRFAHFIDGVVPPERREIEALKIQFRAVAANLLDGQPYAISTGDLGRALQSSSALPLLRRPVPWQGKLFVDAGVIENVPVVQCRQSGADFVLAVDVDRDLAPLDRTVFRHYKTLLARLKEMHAHAVDEPQLKAADFVIHPSVNGIKMASRSRKDIASAIALGATAAENSLPALRAEIARKQQQRDMDRQEKAFDSSSR